MATRKSVGRPRSLSLDAIVDAACEIGIADLDMAVLAERLGTGVATLYGYVRGKDHLFELVTRRLVGQALVKDRGQGWQDILREHAAVTFKIFEHQPQLISMLMGGEPERQSLQYSQLIINMLADRGLDRRTATAAYIELNQVVIGAAICRIRRHAVLPMAVDAQGQPVELPEVLGDYRPTMERVIAGYAAGLSA